MKAIYMEKRGSMELADRPVPEFTEGRAIIKMDMCGICGTDVAGYRGIADNYEYPVIIGHEAVGHIWKIDENNPYGLKEGDRVTCEPYTHCKECYACRQGQYGACDNLSNTGIHQNGMMAEFHSHPLELIHKIPDYMSDEQACMVEPFAIGVNATRRLNVQEGDVCLITGGGAIGLICAMVCKSRGGIPVIADPLESRLATAKEMGVEYVCNNVKEDLPAYIKSINHGHLANRMYECSGATPVQQSMFDYVESAGTIVMVGWPHAVFEMDMAKVIRKALTIVGSRNAADSFPEAIRLVADKVVDADKFVTSVVPIDKTLEVLKDMVDNPARHLKTLIKIS